MFLQILDPLVEQSMVVLAHLDVVTCFTVQRVRDSTREICGYTRMNAGPLTNDILDT